MAAAQKVTKHYTVQVHFVQSPGDGRSSRRSRPRSRPGSERRRSWAWPARAGRPAGPTADPTPALAVPVAVPVAGRVPLDIATGVAVR